MSNPRNDNPLSDEGPALPVNEQERNGQRRSTIRAWLLFAGLFLFSVGGIYLGYEAQRSLASDYEKLNRVHEDLLLLRHVRLLVADAETGQRGYLITREQSYREPYDDAIAQLEASLARLAERLSVYPQSAFLFGPLANAIDAKKDELEETLRYAEANDFNVAERFLREDRGQRYMENIRAATDTIRDSLLQVIETLDTERDGNRFRALMALAFAAAGTVVFLGLLVALNRRNLSRKQQIHRLLVSRNEELDAAVRERTAELRQTNEQFDRSNRELENFAYVVSHDLQEPLRKIRAFGDRLRSTHSDKLDPKAIDYINRMHSAAERMSVLLSDLLNFSRVNTRGLDLTDVDLNEVIAQVIDDLEIMISRSGARIAVDEGLPCIRGDRTQLRQLFQNILANGLKFQPPSRTPELGVRCRLMPGEERESGFVEISIADNGIGFEERYLDRIFDPFQRLHGHAQYSGSGIGLAICRRVAERHGGSLNATSRPGAGSVFVVTLPLACEAIDYGPEISTEQ